METQKPHCSDNFVTVGSFKTKNNGVYYNLDVDNFGGITASTEADYGMKSTLYMPNLDSESLAKIGKMFILASEAAKENEDFHG